MQSHPSSRFVGILLVITSMACIVMTVIPVIVAGALTPNYSHVSQFISELGATGAPYEWWVRLAGFLPAGLLMLAFCSLAYIALPRSRQVTLGLAGLALYASGYLVASAFPCDLGCRPPEPSTSQLIHNAGGLVGYLVAPAFLFALARKARSWPGAGRLVIAGYVTSVIALVGVLTLSPSSGVVGLSQRALEAAVLTWVAMLGIYVARRGAVAGR